MIFERDLENTHANIRILSTLILNTFVGSAVVFILLASPIQAGAQQIPVNNDDVDTTNKRDLIDVFQSTFKYTPQQIKKRGKKKVYFSLVPTSSAVPGGGKALITSTSAGFYL